MDRQLSACSQFDPSSIGRTSREIAGGAFEGAVEVPECAGLLSLVWPWLPVRPFVWPTASRWPVTLSGAFSGTSARQHSAAKHANATNIRNAIVLFKSGSILTFITSPDQGSALGAYWSKRNLPMPLGLLLRRRVPNIHRFARVI